MVAMGCDGNVNNPVGPGDIAAIAGRHGGSAVWASYVYINIGRLEVYGGNGGNGGKRKDRNYWRASQSGEQGGIGGQGGAGGQGRYAFNVARSIKYHQGLKSTHMAAKVEMVAKGGTGGTGGTGKKGALKRKPRR